MQSFAVSVIVPVYNVEKYIDTCVQSILNQTMNNIEVILVDDGSKDSSSARCDYYSLHDKRIRVVHKENAGLGYARNSGLQIATGKYIVFVDGDDYIESNHIEKMFNYIETTGADVTIGGHTKVDNNGGRIVEKNPLAGNTYCDDEIRNKVIPMMCGQLEKDDRIEMSSCMTIYRRIIIEEAGIRFPSERELISEDLIFNMNVLSKARVVSIVDSVGYYYRYNPTSLTHRYLPDRFQKQKQLYKVVEDKTKELGIYSICHQRNMDTFIGWARGHIKAEQAAWRKIGFKKSLENVKRICNDDILQDALIEFDSRYLSRRSKLVNELIRRRSAVLLWCFSGFMRAIKRGT